MKKKKVLLVSINEDGFPFSIAIAALKSYFMENSKFSTQVHINLKNFDFEGSTQRQRLMSIIRDAPDVIGFSCHLYTLKDIYQLCSEIKKIFPQTKLLLGGAVFFVSAKQVMKDNPVIDNIIVGEGGTVFVDLIEHYLFNKGQLDNIKGQIYRKEGIVEFPGPKLTLQNLDELPYYAKSVFSDPDMNDLSIMYIEDARGCIYDCAFCTNQRLFSKIRYPSVEKMKNQVKYAYERGIQYFGFISPTFNQNKRRTIELCEALSQIEQNESAPIRFNARFRPEFIDAEVRKSLEKVNIHVASVGLQTTDKEGNRYLKRGFDRKRYLEGLDFFRDTRTDFVLSIIIGLPGENFLKFTKTLKFSIFQKPRDIFIHILQVYPGTEYYEKKNQFKIEVVEVGSKNILKNFSYSFIDLYISNYFLKRIFTFSFYNDIQIFVNFKKLFLIA